MISLKSLFFELLSIFDVAMPSGKFNFLSSEKVLQYQKDYGIKPNALKLEIGSQGQIMNKQNFAKKYFSSKNLNKWKDLGIDIDAHTGKSGYIKTFGGKGVPRNVITAGELFTEDTRFGKGKKVFDEKAVTNFLKKNLIFLNPFYFIKWFRHSIKTCFKITSCRRINSTKINKIDTFFFKK